MRFQFEKFTISALIIAASAFLFIYVDRLNADIAARGIPFTGLETWVDAYIPFVPEFVWFYYLYYIWVLLLPPVLAEREHFYHAAAAFAVIQAGAIATFILFPSFMVRPVLTPGDSLAQDLVGFIYANDKGYNLVPSLHVGHSVLVALFYRAHFNKVFPIMAVGTLGICASTVYIKQHYFIDIPIGLAFALVSYYITAPVQQLIVSREAAN